MRIRSSLQPDVIGRMWIVTEQAIPAGKRRVLVQRFVYKAWLYCRQPVAIVVGLVLIVAVKTKLRHLINEVVINPGAVRVVAGSTKPLSDGPMDGLNALRHEIIVAADAQRLGWKLHLLGIRCFVCAMTKGTKPRLHGPMHILVLRQIKVAAGAQLASARRKTKFMITRLVGNMAVSAKLLAIPDIMEVRTALVIGVTRGARTRFAIGNRRVG